MSDFAGLSIEGRLATPGEEDWDAARAAWNLAVDQHPRAVAFVESAEDVARVIRHASAHGLSVTAQGTGHGASSLGPLEDTILAKTERMRGVEVDARARTARVEAGVLAAELGANAVRVYRDWAERVPETATSVVRFLRLPPLPDVPEPLRDRPLLTIGAAILGSREEGETLIAPLRELGHGAGAIMDTFAQIPAEGLSRINMDPEHPVPALSHHCVLRELPDAAIDAFVATAGASAGSPLLLAELRHAGGALARAPEGAGALAKLDAAYVMLGIGAPIIPEVGARINEHLDHLSEQMLPWTSEGGYYNFAERPCDLDAILPAETCARLREVKRRWDPDDIVRSNHALSIAAG